MRILQYVIKLISFSDIIYYDFSEWGLKMHLLYISTSLTLMRNARPLFQRPAINSRVYSLVMRELSSYTRAASSLVSAGLGLIDILSDTYRKWITIISLGRRNGGHCPFYHP